MAEFKDFVGSSYAAASFVADAQVSMNVYVEAVESGTGQNAVFMRQKPGLTLALTLPNSPVRGIWIGEGRMFAVAGSRLYEIFSDASYNDRGGVGNDGLPVEIYPNGNQLMVVSAGAVYIDSGSGPVAAVFSDGFSGHVTTAAGVFPLGSEVSWVSGDTFEGLVPNQPITIDGVACNVLAVHTPTSMLLFQDLGVRSNKAASSGNGTAVTASSGAFLDSYFIGVPPNSKRVNISAINNGTAWDPIDFGVKEGYPDNVMRVFADHEELWVFGSQTTEVWRNTGAANFPLERDPGAFVHEGLAAKNSVCRLAGGIGWLAGDAARGGVTAVRAQGAVPTRVSTHAIERAWAGYSTVSDAVSSVYLLEGHEFWVITFPTANATWVYDATANRWHQRGWWNGTSNDRERWMFHGYCFGAHYVGDWSTGKIYTLSNDVYDDAGTAIHWVRAAPHLNTEGREVTYDAFQLLMSTAVGTVISLDWAKINEDGTLTWSAARTLTAANGKRFRWTRLLRSRDRVFRVSGTGRVSIVSAFVDVTVGSV